ncbi:MAG: YicC family protein [Bdellovibrionales bacterium]|nr:YicC family protein [Bdellovibrionales bacterium]
MKIQSMTGYGSAEGEIAGRKYRIEIRTVNHRSLDLKLRIPRELLAVENSLRTFLQNQFARGSMEFRIDRVSESESGSSPMMGEINLELAQAYLAKIEAMGKKLGLSEKPSLGLILGLPEVMTRTQTEVAQETAWKELEPIVSKAATSLRSAREHEGQALVKVLMGAISDLESALVSLRKRRGECESELKEKFSERVKKVFEAYPLSTESVQAVLESRIAQELALILERTDIAEELDRFQGHLDHLKKTLGGSGPIGRKLDFLLQETNREANTLSNKAQDLAMSTEAVQIKLRLEQLREQSMNLE